jgi:hypothetical protein
MARRILNRPGAIVTRLAILVSMLALSCVAGVSQDSPGLGSPGAFPPPGWDLLPNTTSCGIMAADAFHSFYPSLSPDKTDPVMFIINGGGFSQTSVLTLTPDTTYTLTIGVGTRGSGTFAGFDFKVDTVSGTPVGEWIGANRNFVPPGGFGDFSRSFTTGPNPQGQGEKLRLTISQPKGAPANGYTDVQNVRFIAGRAANPHRVDEPIDVLIVAGQSNAHGWLADVSQLSAQNQPYAASPNPLAMLAYKERVLPDPLDNVGTFATLCPQGPGFAGNFNGFGPELALGTDLANHSRHSLAIIKYAIGAAGLNAHFKKSAALLYPPFTAFVTTSLQQLRDQGFAPTLKALFWLQGETDAGDHPDLYGQNITQFVHDLRQDLNAPDLKFFLTEINPNMPAMIQEAQGVKAVNQGMTDLTKQDPLVYFITTDDLTSGFADAVHYNANQQITIGQRWAKAYEDHPAGSGSP